MSRIPKGPSSGRNVELSGKDLEHSDEDLRASDEDLEHSDEDLRASGEDLEHSDKDLRPSDEDLGLSDKDLRASDEDLELSEEDLRASDEDLELSEEELRASDEDLEHSDEDLRASGEDLEHSDEDLRASGEDLRPSGEDLKHTDKDLRTSDEDLKLPNNQLEQFSGGPPPPPSGNSPDSSFLSRLIAFCIREKMVVGLLLLLLAGWGIAVAPFDWELGAFPRSPVPVDAIPDLGENQQIVFAEWPGRSPQDIEDQLTYPLTVELLGISGVREVRSASMFGFSSISLIFEEDVEFYWARSRILEKLASLPAGRLPEGVKPSLGPDATGLGQAYLYTLEGRDPDGKTVGGWDLQELRSVQDWHVRYALLAARGISEVASVGGYVQEYQVDLDPDALREKGVSLAQVLEAVRRSNLDVGARTTEINSVEYVIRGKGFVRELVDLEEAVLRLGDDRIPVRVRDVAHVSRGPAERRGVLDDAGSETVGGVVTVRQGFNTLEAVKNVQRAVEELAPSLPTKALLHWHQTSLAEVSEFAARNGLPLKGGQIEQEPWLNWLRSQPQSLWPSWLTTSTVTVVPYYDRSELIDETLGTLESALSQQLLVTVVVVLMMLAHLRVSILVSSTLPFAVLLTFVAMKVFGIEANVVALAGIAIAIGTIVDMGIIISDNVLLHLKSASPEESTASVVHRASVEVGSAVLTAVLTTVVGFLPVLTMTGAEGKLFRPLAYTKTFVLLASVILAVTMLPALAHVLLGPMRRKRSKKGEADRRRVGAEDEKGVEAARFADVHRAPAGVHSDVHGDDHPGVHSEAGPGFHSDAHPSGHPGVRRDVRRDVHPDARQDGRRVVHPDVHRNIQPDARPDGHSDVHLEAHRGAHPDASPVTHSDAVQPDLHSELSHKTDSELGSGLHSKADSEDHPAIHPERRRSGASDSLQQKVGSDSSSSAKLSSGPAAVGDEASVKGGDDGSSSPSSSPAGSEFFGPDGRREPSGRAVPLLLSGLVIAGVGLARGWSVVVWAGALLFLYGLWTRNSHRLEPVLERMQSAILSRLGSRGRRIWRWFAPRTLNWGVVAVAAALLARAWEPLGPIAGNWRNLLFVALLLGSLVGFFALFERLYPRLLGWALSNRKVFLVLPATLLLAGSSVWLGFERLFAFVPAAAEMVGIDQARIRTSRVWSTAVHAFPGLGREFMPALDEGSFLWMPSTMPHASIGEVKEVLAVQNASIAQIPEVAQVVGKAGRAETALDPAPLGMIETVIHYHPEFVEDEAGRRLRFRVDSEGNFLRDAQGELIEDPRGRPYRIWREHIRNPGDIWDEIARAAHIPGTTTAPKLQPIETRQVMLQTGMSAAMGVKVRAPNLESLDRAAVAIEGTLRKVPGIVPATVNADRVVGTPYLEFDIDRSAIARYGLNVEDVQAVLSASIGGTQATTTVEGRERYPVRVRYQRERRDEIESLERVLVPAPDGAQVPLQELATMRFERGPQMIRSENTFLTAYVTFGGEAGLAEVDVVERAQEALQAALASGELQLPPQVHYSFAGTWEHQLRASRTLAVVLPVALAIVFLLLYFQFRRTSTTAFVFSGIAVSWAGAFVLIWLMSKGWFGDVEILGGNLREIFQLQSVNLSVAVWVGFLALAGIAVDDGVIIATYLGQSFAANRPKTVEAIRQATLQAAVRRARPCLMTTATTLLALLPVLTSTGRGSDIMIPMSIPTVGGMAFALLTMFTVPVLYSFWEERQLLRGFRAGEKEAA